MILIEHLPMLWMSSSLQQMIQGDWNQLKESNTVFEDFLLYPSCRTKYSSVVTNGNGTVHDANTFDVT